MFLLPCRMMTIRDGYPLDVPVDDGRLLLLLLLSQAALMARLHSL